MKRTPLSPEEEEGRPERDGNGKTISSFSFPNLKVPPWRTIIFSHRSIEGSLSDIADTSKIVPKVLRIRCFSSTIISIFRESPATLAEEVR